VELKLQKIQLMLLIPMVIVVAIAYTVLWRLWHATHQTVLMISHAAWTIELIRTLVLVSFLGYSAYRRHYHDFAVASVCCSMTDAAWLIRLMSVQVH
jgi:hypothetical protein